MAGYLSPPAVSHGGRPSLPTWWHPGPVLHPGAVWFTCSPTSETPESNQQPKPVFQQKNKTHSAAHGHCPRTEQPSVSPVPLPCPGCALTGEFTLAVSVRSQARFTLVAYVGLSMASSPMKKSGRQHPQYPPLWQVRPPSPILWWRYLREDSTSVPSHTRSFQPSRKDDIVPMRVQSEISTLGFCLGSACSEEHINVQGKQAVRSSIIFSKAQRNLTGLLSKLTKAVLLNFLVSSEKKSLKIVSSIHGVIK